MDSTAQPGGGIEAPETQGLVMNWGWRYDLMLWAVDGLLRGRLRALRHRTLELAAPQPGESVLDVGCGTGTLALQASAVVGQTGRVAGIDPGSRQIARARSKADRVGRAVDFRTGVIEDVPFADDSFQVVLSTMMLHHLPEDLKRRGLSEIRRVLEPRGRLVVADFLRPEKGDHGRSSFGAGETGAQDQPELLERAGFDVVEREVHRLPRLPMVPGAGLLLARKP